MKKLFVPYNIAVLAKEKGFHEPCFNYYLINGELNTITNKIPYECKAPTHQQLIDWFRGSPRFIQILEQPEKFSDREPMYCIKERGASIGKRMPLNKALEEAFKLI